jgi:hypothetical protein
MNGKTFQQTQSRQTSSDSCINSKWREADHCNPKCYPVGTEPISSKLRIEEDSTETVVINNSIQTEQLTRQRSAEQLSGTISKLAWLLFGLASLLFLGSMVLLVAYGRSANNHTITKETVNNINHTREVIRTEKVEDVDGYYYAPRARW